VRECTAYRRLQVSPVAGALGAEVQGVDLVLEALKKAAR